MTLDYAAPTSDSAPAWTQPPARSRDRVLASFSPLIIAAVFAGGFAWLVGWPKWPVADAGERIAYASLVAAVLAAVVSVVSRPLLRVALHVLAGLACVLPTMWPLYQNGTWTVGTLALWTVAAVFVIARASRLLFGLGRQHGVLGWLVMLGMTASGGGLLMATGSLKLGQAGFALAAGVLIAFIGAIFVPAIRRSPGAPLMAMATLGGLLVSGHLWSELPLSSALCVALAPLLAWIVRVPLIARRPLWQRVAIGLIVAAIPATVVTTAAAIKAQHASEAADEYGY